MDKEQDEQQQDERQNGETGEAAEEQGQGGEQGADLFDHLNSELDALSDSEPAGEKEDAGADEEPEKPEEEAEGDEKEEDKEAGKEKEGGGQEEEEDPDALELTEDERKELSERAQQRFERLATRAREAAKQAETYRQQVEGWQEMVRESRASPEEFAQAIEYMRLIHSDDPDEQRQALKVLEAERAALAKRLGEPVAGVDLLSDYPDLQQRVKDMEIDEQTAHEIARARIMEQRQRERIQQQQSSRAQQQTQQTRIQQAAAQLNALGERLAKEDPDYTRKLEILKKHVIPRIRRLPPEEWAAAFEDQYRMLDELAPAVAPKPRVNTGTRRAGAAGGGRPEPKSMEEAIAQSLENME